MINLLKCDMISLSNRGGEDEATKHVIFLTHCSATKDRSLERTHAQVTPDKMYTATRIQRFMLKCKDLGVNWAVFSDRYGSLRQQYRIRNPIS